MASDPLSERIPVGLPRHQPAHRFRHHRFGPHAVGPLGGQVTLEHEQGRLGRPGGGQALGEEFGGGAPDLIQVEGQVDQFAGGQPEQRRRAGTEPDAEHGRPRLEDLHGRTGQRADQARPRTEREVQLDAAGGKVPLCIGLRADPLDPRHADQVTEHRHRRLLDVGLRGTHYCTVLPLALTGVVSRARRGSPQAWQMTCAVRW